MAEAGRQDYAHLVRASQLQPGEPFFFIRGRDAVSGPAVRAWAALAYEAGSPPALLEQAMTQADAMDAWGTKHVPDADHLAPAEAAQLEYAFGRRAWSSREDAVSPAIMLAERRGYDQARADIRALGRSMSLVIQAVAETVTQAGWMEGQTEAQADAARRRIATAIRDAQLELERLGLPPIPTAEAETPGHA